MDRCVTSDVQRRKNVLFRRKKKVQKEMRENRFGCILTIYLKRLARYVLKEKGCIETVHHRG